MAISTPRGRRTVLAGGACWALASALPARAALPDKPMRLIVGSSAAGGTDKMARSIAARLETRIGRHVTVQNKPSFNGAAGGEALLKGTNDGTALSFMNSEVLAGKLLIADFPFDPLKDITPVTIAGNSQTGLAVSARTGGIATFEDYLAWLKGGDAERRRIGVGPCPTFAEVFKHVVEPKIDGKLEFVPYRGAAPMISDLGTGRLPACLASVTSLLEYHRGPRLKIVLSSGAARSPLAANVPTAKELGLPALEMPEWFGVFASSGVPAPIVEEWNRQLVAVIGDGEVKAELQQLGLEVAPSTIADAAKRVGTYLEEWKQCLARLGLGRPA